MRRLSRVLDLRGAAVWTGLCAAIALVPPAVAADVPGARLVDGFEGISGWSAHPADGVALSIAADAGDSGKALRLDFDFRKGGGYAVVHKDLALDLPANYAFTFRLRGAAPANHLEFKLIDASGENVWWCVRRDLQFPHDWQTFTIKRRQIRFAWGPAGGGELTHAAALEFSVTAGSGGTGSVWIDQLELRALPPADAPMPPPTLTASTAAKQHDAGLAGDGQAETHWESARSDAQPWLALDLHGAREFGGLTLDWVAGRAIAPYTVDVSDDGHRWRTARTVQQTNGGRDDLALPESEAAFLRIRALAPAGRGKANPFALAELRLQPLVWSASGTAFFQALAQQSPRGSYPRGITGEQSYWAVVGVDGDEREGLLGEDGALETGKGQLSIEPFLRAGDRLITWADARITQSLPAGCLPMPTVQWQAGELELTITAFGSGQRGASAMVARYVVRNTGPARAGGSLDLALRPFQVDPPAQTLNHAGGYAPVPDLELTPPPPSGGNAAAIVAGRTVAIALTAPTAAGATSFDAGEIVADDLRSGHLPPQMRAEDPQAQAASGAWSFAFDLEPAAQQEFVLLVPLYDRAEFGSAAARPPQGDDAAARAWAAARADRCQREWDLRFRNVTVQLPDSAAVVVQSLRAQLAWILINRAGPAIQPGPRSYARSWIRDGALTSSALLRLGQIEPVQQFIEWFAPNQYDNGKIPCCVDARGADPVPEHDSSGEFIYLVAEYHRYAHDQALVERLYPRVLRAAAYLDSLRQQRRTDEYRRPDRAEFFGLLPPSISHEGYSAKPMHSYWDDFWALRGFADAAELAGTLGHTDDQERLSAIRDQFAGDLAASVRAAMARHSIDYVPGCADLGDFDATSTTIALSPTGADAILPPAAVQRTFERYWDSFNERRGGAAWDAYTPYEIRNLGAFVRLGWRDRAQELLAAFLADQRPTGWRQWPEVVWRDARAAKFLGDLPHTWVGSDYVRSMLDMLAYVRERDAALVLAAGVPLVWIAAEPGVVVRQLPTPYGPLSYTLALRAGVVEARIEGALRVPSGGIVLTAPTPWPVTRVTLNGKAAKVEPDGSVRVRTLPATVVLAH